MVRKKIIKNILYTTAFFVLFSFNNVHAATLSVETNSSQVKIGDIVTATIYVNAEGQAINNVEALFSVPADILEIQSVSILGSNLSLWVEQPTHSKSSVTFNGGVPNPGYSGSKGKILTVFMKALKSGTAPISFQSASVRANDGLGTDVLNNRYGTSVVVSSNIISPETQTATPVAPNLDIDLPKTPIIKSAQAPDSDRWYNLNDVTFDWDLPEDVTSVKTLFDRSPKSDPLVLYSPAIDSKKVEDVEEGVFYFHLRYKNYDGWSKTAHKRIMIDTTPPEDTMSDYEITDSGLVQINLNGYDTSSPIEKFILSTSNEENIIISDVNSEGEVNYVFPDSFAGLKTIRIETFDAAGNISTSFIEIDFPVILKDTESIEQEGKYTITEEPEYVIWGNKIVKILSVAVPVIAMIILLVIFIYIIIIRIITERKKDTRAKRIKRLEREAMLMIKTLREEMLEDIHVFKTDKSVTDVEEVENILLKNLLQDLKTVEKVVSKRLRRVHPKKIDSIKRPSKVKKVNITRKVKKPKS